MINRQPLNDKFTWMHSGQTGAPQVTAKKGSEGELLQMLDATLVSGFNEQIATSVSIDGSRVILNFGLAPGFLPRQRVTISGSDDPLLNGNHAVVEITPQAIVLNISGVTITTGIVKAKVAPLGFESIFGSANPLKRAYRSKDLTSTRTVLYLDMSLRTGHGYSSSPVQRAMVTLCGDMTTLGVPINSHTDIINGYAKNANGTLMWHVGRSDKKKDTVNEATNRSWVIVGNGKIFYLFMRWQTLLPAQDLARDFYAFGDTDPLADQDNFGCIWAGAMSPNDTDSEYYTYIHNGPRISNTPEGSEGSDSVGIFIKSYDGVANAEKFAVGTGINVQADSGFMNVLPNINTPTQSMIVMNAYTIVTGGMRSLLPRLKIISTTVPKSMDLDMADDTLIVVLGIIKVNPTINYGAYAIDLGD